MPDFFPFGKGKYDDACSAAREATKGEVILIVTNGEKGNGFSCQTSFETLLRLPKLLRMVADDIEKQRKRMTESNCV